MLYFRPYELFTFLADVPSMAYWPALFAIISYIVTQLSAGRSITILTPEIKCILFITTYALLLMPLSRDIGRSWEVFINELIKTSLIFIIMANVLFTEARIKTMMWLGVAIGVYLSYQSYDLNQRGVFNTLGNRVSVDVGGMFGNPNDMAIHLVIFIPIAIALGLNSHKRTIKYLCYTVVALMTYAIILTQSRGGFLGLIAVAVAIIWKFGRGHRIRLMLISSILAICFIMLAPGEYGTRFRSIFNPSLDSTGSSSEREELLKRSIIVTLRNPLGVGLGNSTTFGVRNLVTHNAYTQVSSELGWLSFGAYLIFLIVPLRFLSKIETEMNISGENSSIYLLIIGTQIGIIGYMVSSFFASVAYQWYVYYPIAFAIGFRLVYERSQP